MFYTVEGTTQYQVMQNTINRTIITPFGILTNKLILGISVNNGGQLINEVYKNTINNGNYNLYTVDENRGTLDGTVGLAFKCNTINSTAVDNTINIAIINNGGITLTIGIEAIQGIPASASNPISLSYTNQFSPPPLTTGTGII